MEVDELDRRIETEGIRPFVQAVKGVIDRRHIERAARERHANSVLLPVVAHVAKPLGRHLSDVVIPRSAKNRSRLDFDLAENGDDPIVIVRVADRVRAVWMKSCMGSVISMPQAEK